MSKKLTLGHSPDPDDAFMFYALAEHKIDTHGYEFEHILQDIQTLNERATREELDITAVSIHAYAYLLDKYALLPSGASMGDGYGPLVVVPHGKGIGNLTDDLTIQNFLREKRIAIPGKMTSAYLALRLYLGEFEDIVVPFDKIFDAVREGRADAGLIIHEGQLTYGRDGFEKVLDLGEWWKNNTGLPLPLGGNVISRRFPVEEQKKINAILHESIRYGLEDRKAAVDHSMSHARGLDTAMADEFIGMYVNDLTLDYGDRGREAVHKFLAAASEAGLIPAPVGLTFVEG